VVRKLLIVTIAAATLLGAAACSSFPVSGSTGSKSHKTSPHKTSSHPTSTKSGKVTYTVVTQPKDGYTPIYHLITSARSSLDMTMYELVDTTAEADLAAAAKRGVKVRVILDASYEKSSNTPAYTYLTGHGVHVVWSWDHYAITHQKTLTADDKTTAIMTGNLTSRYYSTTRDFTLIENDSSDVSAIEKVFNADYAHTAITPSDGDHLVWSPTDSESQLLALINGAKHSLSIENEEMDDPTVTTALEKAAGRGVDVKVIMTNDSNGYASEFNALTSAGAHVHTYAYTASLYIHAKVIIADGTKVFLGSENFSDYSLTKNRELGFITTSSAILKPISSTLTSDYNGATNWSGGSKS
jgi:cardiolipin synthase A/B